jgi:cell division protein FtsW (lipid II flippase)
MSSVYRIHKGINQPIEFKGLKAQYIWWLGGGILALLFLFAVLYIAGVNMVACVLVVFGLGAGVFWYVYSMSKQYGAHGMMKKMAARRVPGWVRGIRDCSHTGY